MQRIAIAEWLDSDSGTPEEISVSLDDLWRINRWFGGVGTTEGMLRGVAQELGKSSLSLLEVASGSGYVPQICKERLEQDGVNIEFTLVEQSGRGRRTCPSVSRRQLRCGELQLVCSSSWAG